MQLRNRLKVVLATQYSTQLAVRIMYYMINDRKNNLYHFKKLLSAVTENLVSSCSRSYIQFSLLESI